MRTLISSRKKSEFIKLSFSVLRDILLIAAVYWNEVPRAMQRVTWKIKVVVHYRPFWKKNVSCRGEAMENGNFIESAASMQMKTQGLWLRGNLGLVHECCEFKNQLSGFFVNFCCRREEIPLLIKTNNDRTCFYDVLYRILRTA